MFNNFGGEPRFSTSLGGFIVERTGGFRASITIHGTSVANERNDDVTLVLIVRNGYKIAMLDDIFAGFAC